ncbi:MAG: transposase [Desulfosoma sp.]
MRSATEPLRNLGRQELHRSDNRILTTLGEWPAFYARLCRLIALCRDSEAGKFVGSIEKHMDSLFIFLLEEGVESTNNFAERITGFAVNRRKRSLESNSEKGCRWVERILLLLRTCRLQGRSSFATPVKAMSGYFRGHKPHLTWIRSATAQ